MITWKKYDILVEKMLDTGKILDVLSSIFSQEQADQFVDAMVVLSEDEKLQQMQTAKRALEYLDQTADISTVVSKLDADIANKLAPVEEVETIKAVK